MKPPASRAERHLAKIDDPDCECNLAIDDLGTKLMGFPSNMNDRIFRDEHKFQDDVWGQITLNTLERDVIDTPEYQRLFRTGQLGFVDLVYQAANHTGGAHSIGACLVAYLEQNETGMITILEHAIWGEIARQRFLEGLERTTNSLNGSLLHELKLHSKIDDWFAESNVPAKEVTVSYRDGKTIRCLISCSRVGRTNTTFLMGVEIIRGP